MKENEKHLDLELLLFFIFVSFITFFFYVFRHPLFPALVTIGNNGNIYNLFKAYLPDMIVYLSVFIPYIIIIISLIIYKLVKKNKIPDNIIVILFFPLISFFTKGMSLIDIYTENNLPFFILKILKDNITFYVFIFIGPLLLLIHYIIFSILKKNNNNK